MSRHCGFPVVPVVLAALLLGATTAQVKKQREAPAPPLPTEVAPLSVISPSPTPSLSADPEATIADAVTPDVAGENALPKIQKAVRDYIRERYPNSRVEGVFTLPLGRGHALYLAGADTVVGSGQKRRTIDVLVRLYARRNGSVYWRAESLGSQDAAALLLSRPGGPQPDSPAFPR